MDSPHSSLILLPPDRAPEIVDVLCEAFYDYPVMRFVLGDPDDYGDRIRTLIGYFVAARALRDGVLLGMELPDGSLGAAATVTPPEQGPVSETLREIRLDTWDRLGPEAEANYATLSDAWATFEWAQPHHHLNMIGVTPEHQGLGWASALLRRVHRLADDDPGSAGVSLTTETAGNVPIYRHFGYEAEGPIQAGTIESWGCFRAARQAG